MKKELASILLLFFFITLFFFYPVIRGYIPFPGDLLTGNYAPYNTQSYFGYPPGGVPHKAQGPDVVREAYPWKTFVVDQLKKGEIPFWSPYNFAGNPILANFQSAVFYPGNIFFFLLPFINAWTLLIFLGPFLAGFFTYLFLREIQVSKLSGLFGGIIFAFSSYMVVWIEYGNITHTFLWLPLALLFTERLLKTFTKKNLLFLLVTLLFSLSGGYIQGYFYVLLTVLVYFLFKSIPQKKIGVIKILLFFAVLIAPFFLFLYQLLPTLHLFRDSSRHGYSLTQIQELLNPVWYTITTVIPNFFGHPAARNHWFTGTYIERVSYFGLIPFIFAVSSLFAFKKKKEIVIFGAIFLGAFFLATDFFINKYFYLLPIPVFSTTVPTRILGLFVFAGSILAAIGLDYFLQKKYPKYFLIPGVSVFIIIVSAFVVTLFGPKLFSDTQLIANLSIAKRNIVLPLIFAGSFLAVFLIQFYSTKLFKRNLPVIFLGIFLIAVTVFDLFYFFHKITPFSPKEYIYPQTPVVSYLQSHAGFDRFWGYGSAYIGSNFQTFDKTYSPEGEDPLHLRWYTEFVEATKDGKVPDTLPRPDANIAPGYGSGNFENNPYRQKFLNLAGVKYILNKQDGLGEAMLADHTTFSGDKYKLIWQESPWQIYENLSVAPRAFITNDYTVIEDDKKVIEAFFSEGFDEKTTLILSKDPGIQKNPLTKGKVEITKYTPNKVVLATQSEADGMLFLSDTYASNWIAEVDGKPVVVYRADYAFRAIPVPAGKHEAVFRYESQTFQKGLVASGLFAIALGLVFAFIKLKKQ